MSKKKYRCHFLVSGVSENAGRFDFDGTAAVRVDEGELLEENYLYNRFRGMALKAFYEMAVPKENYGVLSEIVVSISKVEEIK
ncbi:hypothetical protein [Chitinimonas lacunae]|uniref:Uncharacterized protein n=1 Tax=Chitinimonas lacunae TaxID=1963018 RepID=A0ABV8MKS6_9NEIS